MHAVYPVPASEIHSRGGLRPRLAPARAAGMLSQGRNEADDLAALVRAVSKGDRTAFATLFRKFAPRIKGFLARSGADSGTAEDLAQETLVQVWRRAFTFDSGRASVATWVFTIARNLWIDQVRRSSGRPAHEPQEAWLADLTSEPVLGEQRRERVRSVLASLPREQSEALHMAYFGDATHEQIAARLRIPLGTVKSRIRLAIATLRHRLDGLEL